MKRWPTKQLGELVAISKGKKALATFAAPTKTSLRYLQIEDLRVDATMKYCEPFSCPKATKLDAIIAWDGANAGTVSCNLEGHIGSTLAILRPIESNALLAQFLSRFLEGNFDYLQKTATGATIPHVSKSALCALQVPLPTLMEQERIVKLLDEAGELRKLRAQATSRTACLIPALFHEMFGKPLADSIPYPVKRIAELVREGDRINYGVVQPGDEVPDGIPIVRAGDFDGMSINREHLKCISPEIEKSYSRSRLRGDEILISCVGSIGSVALADSSLTGFNIVRAVARVPLRDEIDQVFVASQLMTPELQNFFRRETRTVAQPTLNIRQIEETPIILPPLALQREFAQRVTEIRELEASQAASRAHLDALFQSMLHRAFNGEL
jgi:type I restriction enzyme S subunit